MYRLVIDLEGSFDDGSHLVSIRYASLPGRCAMFYAVDDEGHSDFDWDAARIVYLRGERGRIMRQHKPMWDWGKDV